MSGPLILERQWWTLQRFGFSPDTIWYRWTNQHEPIVLCNSLPKAGTHLLERAVCLAPRLYRKLVPTIHEENIYRWGSLDNLLVAMKPGQVLVTHLRYYPERQVSIENHKVRSLFMIRDPRDIVVSQAFYISREARHPRHAVFAEQPDVQNRIRLAITGHAPSGLESIGERLQAYAGWLTSGALVIRFEDLVGGSGGGSDTAQQNILDVLYQHLGIEMDPTTREVIQRQVFSSVSPTFRKGSTGKWREYFDDVLTDLFKEVAGAQLVAYGYESDLDW
ncbi:MAG: hypothetical protein D6694_00280 [Gammaproteobacteria bacterium]|nr:MAG: hypothetical protein D6694_00280 [Gammaproteobacteria bacterium]